ncbi:(deoxy)nucleoside triphosphate pyrophosphohydrolase [Corynebacterium afermentans]|uniref:(deoxy)nucleoside triphosphate pyrophosphohydrolase n=1 Tax=Corynebacterium afermentans TaxID=38286 RepID=UPI00257414D9|nr:(deoxy)nucleoside triphosphate pyrophosphohydrolase [Corynebacterium afermentans]MCG7292888.1 (deoxy)nucleoside triphosphate pyrophosphohydrolase [Corynebacterium afermentans]
MLKKIEVVGAALIDEDRVFAARRGPGKAMAGYWEFPGGKIEPGESPEHALARELNEELKIDVSVGEFLVTATHDTGSAVIKLSTYLCDLTAGTPVLTEHSESRWVPAAELGVLTWAPADIPTVELLQERFA